MTGIMGKAFTSRDKNGILGKRAGWISDGGTSSRNSMAIADQYFGGNEGLQDVK